MHVNGKLAPLKFVQPMQVSVLWDEGDLFPKGKTQRGRNRTCEEACQEGNREMIAIVVLPQIIQGSLICDPHNISFLKMYRITFILFINLWSNK
jgi:hypothetical protein